MSANAPIRIAAITRTACLGITSGASAITAGNRTGIMTHVPFCLEQRRADALVVSESRVDGHYEQEHGRCNREPERYGREALFHAFFTPIEISHRPVVPSGPTIKWTYTSFLPLSTGRNRSSITSSRAAWNRWVFDHDRIAVPMAMGLMPVLDPAARPKVVTAAATTAVRCAGAHHLPHPVPVRLPDRARLRKFPWRTCLPVLQRTLCHIESGLGQGSTSSWSRGHVSIFAPGPHSWRAAASETWTQMFQNR